MLPSVRQIENFPTESGDKPTAPIVIAKSGVLTAEEVQAEASQPAAGTDPYEDYPDDEDRDVQDPNTAFEIAKAIREYGNTLFKEGKVEDALAKYQSEEPCVTHSFRLHSSPRICQISRCTPCLA